MTLEEAALGPSGSAFSLIIDFVSVGGLPDCRLPGVIEWCMQHDCAPIASARQCLTLDPSPGVRQGLSLAQAVRMQVSALGGTPLLSDAPLEPVIVRAMASRAPCNALTDPTSSPEMPFGCAYSCPIELGQEDGDITLDLGFIGRFPGDQDCYGLLHVCSTVNFRPGP
jgi:hypothetical protein